MLGGNKNIDICDIDNQWTCIEGQEGTALMPKISITLGYLADLKSALDK